MCDPIEKMDSEAETLEKKMCQQEVMLDVQAEDLDKEM